MERKRRRARPALGIAAALLLGALGGWVARDGAGGARADEELQAVGRAAVERFYDALEQGGAALDPVLAPGFQLIRSDGRRYDRTAYLAAPSALQTFTLGDLTTTLAGDSLVVTFNATYETAIDGVAERGESLPRMAVFVRDGEAWDLAAYANLASGAGDVQAVAAEAVAGFLDAVGSGDPAAVAAVLAPEFQLLRSDGRAFGAGDYPAQVAGIKRVGQAQILDLVATGHGDVLVARYRLETEQTIDGKVTETRAPRLAVFRRSAGKWLLSAYGNFAQLTPP